MRLKIRDCVGSIFESLDTYHSYGLWSFVYRFELRKTEETKIDLS
jgi:hypothetical protein